MKIPLSQKLVLMPGSLSWWVWAITADVSEAPEAYVLEGQIASLSARTKGCKNRSTTKI